MQRLDKATIDSGIAGEVLMERAGEFVAEETNDYINSQKSNVLVLVGGGNNGGDGFVAARLLHDKGISVNVLCLSREEKLQGDALLNYNRLLDSGLTPLFIDEIDDSIVNFFAMTDIIIDALLGTGAKGAPRNLYADIIELANKSEKPILAVDIPSGVMGDTGKTFGVAIDAETTVTFGYSKIGQFIYPGREKTGKLKVCDIGIIPELIDNEKLDLRLNTYEEMKKLIPKRPKDGHKGTFGKGYILAGSQELSGAAIMTSLSFLRAGAGLAYLGIPRSIEPIVSSRALEVISHPLPEIKKRGALSTRALGEIHKRLPEMDAAIIGPGMGSHHETIETVIKLMKKLELPCIVDADGLNALAKCDEKDIFKNIKADTIFTPHPGELSRLIDMPIDEIEKNKFHKASEWAKKLNTILIIKGSPTLIAIPEGPVYLNLTGNDGMATAGSGDILSGILGSLLAQGLKAFEAARLGVYLHGIAGDIASEEIGKRSMIASDMLEFIGDAFWYLENEQD